MDLPRIGHLWEDICGYIIRPTRAEYDEEELGPNVFRLSREDKRQYRREDVELENMRGMKMKCTWFYPNKCVFPIPTVVYLHGNCGCRCDALEILHLLGHGFSLFCYDACGSGMSDGEYVSLGFYERQDLATVIEHINETGRASTIGLWGRSMGAVTAIMYASKDPSIKALVLDSPFSQLRRLILDLVREHAKVMPDAWTQMAVKKIRKKIARMASFDIDDLDVVKYGQQCTVPTFIFHGEDDVFVRPYHSELIAEHFAGMCFHHRVQGGHNSFRKNDVMNVAIPHLELYLIEKPAEEKVRKEAEAKKRAEEEAIRKYKAETAAAALAVIGASGKGRQLKHIYEEQARIASAAESGEYIFSTLPPTSPGRLSRATSPSEVASGCGGASSPPSVTSPAAAANFGSGSFNTAAPSPPRLPSSRPPITTSAGIATFASGSSGSISAPNSFTTSSTYGEGRGHKTMKSGGGGSISAPPRSPFVTDDDVAEDELHSSVPNVSASTATMTNPLTSIGSNTNMASSSYGYAPPPSGSTSTAVGVGCGGGLGSRRQSMVTSVSGVSAAGSPLMMMGSAGGVVDGHEGRTMAAAAVDFNNVAITSPLSVPIIAAAGEDAVIGKRRGSNPSSFSLPTGTNPYGNTSSAVATAASPSPTTDAQMGAPSTCRAEDEDTDDDETFEAEFVEALNNTARK